MPDDSDRRTASRSRTTRGAGATARRVLLDPGPRHGQPRAGRSSAGPSAAATAASRPTTAGPARRDAPAGPVRPLADGRGRDRGARRRRHRARARRRRVDGWRDRADHRRAAPRARALADARVHRVPPPRLAPRAARRSGPRSSTSARHARADRRRHALAHRPAPAAPLRRLDQRARARAHADEARSRSSRRSSAILRDADELRDELHTITAPTLVITGSQDTLTPVGDAEELAELIPTLAPLRAARRRARPHGRGAERVQRRRAALPRRGRRRPSPVRRASARVDRTPAGAR